MLNEISWCGQLIICFIATFIQFQRIVFNTIKEIDLYMSILNYILKLFSIFIATLTYDDILFLNTGMHKQPVAQG